MRVANQLAGEPQERLLKVIIGLGRNIVVLEILLAMESNRLCLDFSLFNIDLVTAKDDRNVLANTDKITYSSQHLHKEIPLAHANMEGLHTMPVGNVLVGNA